ncbi:MAG: cupin domain-containing protein [Ruminococcus sp.]|nr:cupin domain-containing protein [Ruminococcus sp.]
MIINFNSISEAFLEKFKGGDGGMFSRQFTDCDNKIMLNRLPVGASVGYHKHECNSEIIYIFSGEAKCIFDDNEEYFSAGECHYCPKGHSHSLINNSKSEELCFFAVVAEHSK